MNISSFTTLQKREIQAPLVARILRGFIAELGYERAMQIASAAIQADAAQAGADLAAQSGSNSLADLLKAVQEIWAADGALDITVLENSEKLLRFNVTRCRYAELYERQGVRKFGYCLSCNRDAALIEGFNPRMQLQRTQTIMQGAEACDFKITLE
jgi:hypothetical protein